MAHVVRPRKASKRRPSFVDASEAKDLLAWDLCEEARARSLPLAFHSCYSQSQRVLSDVMRVTNIIFVLIN